MRFLFIMDPASHMLPDRDTTFAFMRGAMARGHECLHCLPRALEVHKGLVFAWVTPVTVSDTPPHVTTGQKERVDLGQLDAIFVRNDPPFDPEYLHQTQILDLVANKTLVINSPRGLREANEKLFALQFHELMPRSAVLADRDGIFETVQGFGGRAVIKVLDGAGGIGVLGLDAEDKNARGIVDIMTREGRDQVMIQEYQPAVREGDKRVLMLDGELLGAILRVPRKDDLRANIHAGGSVALTQLTPKEQHIADVVGPRLRAEGLYFVGLDFIGEKLIEVNVTSPTGIQELGRLSGTKPEETVIEWVERRA